MEQVQSNQASFSMKMPSVSVKMWLLLGFLGVALSCKENGHSLTPYEIPSQISANCSKKIEDISTYTKLVTALDEDVVGVYMWNETGHSTAQLCYWKAMESDYDNLLSLTGGNFYILGM